jgi:hypothetical protein
MKGRLIRAKKRVCDVGESGVHVGTIGKCSTAVIVEMAVVRNEDRAVLEGEKSMGPTLFNRVVVIILVLV